MGFQASYILRMEDGPTLGEIFELTKPSLTIGREIGPDIDISIPSPTVSRVHARLSRQGDQWHIEDASGKSSFLRKEASSCQAETEQDRQE